MNQWQEASPSSLEGCRLGLGSLQPTSPTLPALSSLSRAIAIFPRVFQHSEDLTFLLSNLREDQDGDKGPEVTRVLYLLLSQEQGWASWDTPTYPLPGSPLSLPPAFLPS